MVRWYIVLVLGVLVYLTTVKTNKKINNDEVIKDLFVVRVIAGYIKNKVKKDTLKDLILRISIAENSSLQKAEKTLDKHITTGILLAIFSGSIVLALLKVWYLALAIGLVVAYFYYNYENNKVNKKIKRVEISFPEIIHHFSDEYAVHKNSKAALIAIVERTNNKTAKMVFEHLVRQVHTKGDWATEIDKMAETFGFFYAYAFAEILKLSITDLGDISKELEDLIELIQQDIEQREQNRSAIHESKIMFIVINSMCAFAIGANILFHEFAKDVYSYTSMGSTLIVIWLLQVIIGIFYVKAAENS